MAGGGIIPLVANPLTAWGKNFLDDACQHSQHLRSVLRMIERGRVQHSNRVKKPCLSGGSHGPHSQGLKFLIFVRLSLRTSFPSAKESPTIRSKSVARRLACADQQFARQGEASAPDSLQPCLQTALDRALRDSVTAFQRRFPLDRKARSTPRDESRRRSPAPENDRFLLRQKQAPRKAAQSRPDTRDAPSPGWPPQS